MQVFSRASESILRADTLTSGCVLPALCDAVDDSVSRFVDALGVVLRKACGGSAGTSLMILGHIISFYNEIDGSALDCIASVEKLFHETISTRLAQLEDTSAGSAVTKSFLAIGRPHLELFVGSSKGLKCMPRARLAVATLLEVTADAGLDAGVCQVTAELRVLKGLSVWESSSFPALFQPLQPITQIGQHLLTLPEYFDTDNEERSQFWLSGICLKTSKLYLEVLRSLPSPSEPGLKQITADTSYLLNIFDALHATEPASLLKDLLEAIRGERDCAPSPLVADTIKSWRLHA